MGEYQWPNMSPSQTRGVEVIAGSEDQTTLRPSAQERKKRICCHSIQGKVCTFGILRSPLYRTEVMKGLRSPLLPHQPEIKMKM